MPTNWRDDAPVYLAGAAAVTAEISIAGSMIFLGMALVSLFVSRRKLRWPPLTVPVLLWIGWTLVSLAFSGHARGGFPQVKKFLWWPMLFVVYNAVRTLQEIRMIALGWAAAATASSLWGFKQYIHKYLTTPIYFENVYSNDRITGFMGIWMTYSGQMMMALMIIGAILLFSKDRKWFGWLVAAGFIVGTGLLLALTRNTWAGAAVGALWLLWFKRKWLVISVPVLAALVLAANPFGVRDRALDAIHPRYNMTDSGTHRAVLRRVGWEMIKAHPFVGVGAEQVAPQFMQYLPADIPRPIPTNWYTGHLHNIYYHFAAERGIPALLALLWLLLGSLTIFAKAARKLPPDSEARWMLHAGSAVIVAVMISGYWELNLGDSEVLAMFLAVLACVFVAAESSHTEGARR